MFKVEKIKEKLDLEVNDSNRCKSIWIKTKGHPYPWGDACCEDCCRDCSNPNEDRSYMSVYY
ncbi:hypothetical protein [Paraclostridium sordellii]|uniref:hypothetical protein n=1 Tax=Paraclostridium sordellii TaxID=1505 RepID=UPI0003862C9A|nr:hypothetical protein [Paeniclostridium sordellii]EPZ61846.1 hypothetical protein H476_3536 [[Clostridium] sordellii VPI 9048] [Paeniclostridium sordellii VPI 9048]CEK39957.1 hypothetical protein JGS6382_32851 [[Clostridium] sordellii] [Paeniclostridium sordellii]